MYIVQKVYFLNKFRYHIRFWYYLSNFQATLVMDAAILRQQQQLQQEQLQIQQQQLQQQQSVIQQQQQQAETQQRTAAATAATADHGGDILAEICLNKRFLCNLGTLH